MANRINTVLAVQNDIGIVFHVKFPKRIAGETFDLIKIPAQIAEQIEHMYALVKQNTSTGYGFIVAPGLLKPHAAAFAVNTAHVDDGSKTAAVDDHLGLDDTGMETVIKTEHELNAVFLMFTDIGDVADIAAGRFLTKHLFTRFHGFNANIRGKTIRSTD